MAVNQKLSLPTHRAFLSCYVCPTARRSHCQLEKTEFNLRSKIRSHTFKFLTWNDPKISGSFFSTALLYSLQKRKIDAASNWCSFVVLKMLPWLFHYISSFCAFANEFNDPKKVENERERYFFNASSQNNCHTNWVFFAHNSTLDEDNINYLGSQDLAALNQCFV